MKKEPINLNFKAFKANLKLIIDFDNIIPAAILAVIILGTELKNNLIMVDIICFLFAVYRIHKTKYYIIKKHPYAFEYA